MSTSQLTFQWPPLQGTTNSTAQTNLNPLPYPLPTPLNASDPISTSLNPPNSTSSLSPSPTSVWSSSVHSNLDKNLGPEFFENKNTSDSPSVKLWKFINLANELFGFDGWSSSVSNVTTDCVDGPVDVQLGLKTVKVYSATVTAVVRITLKDGTYRDGIGSASTDHSHKGTALTKAKKQAVNEALGEAFSLFGNALGNCMFNTEYMDQAAKLDKPTKPPLDLKDLYRMPEFRQGKGPKDNTTSSTATSSSSKEPEVLFNTASTRSKIRKPPKVNLPPSSPFPSSQQGTNISAITSSKPPLFDPGPKFKIPGNPELYFLDASDRPHQWRGDKKPSPPNLHQPEGGAHRSRAKSLDSDVTNGDDMDAQDGKDD